MDVIEGIIFIGSLILTIMFLVQWYAPLLTIWQKKRVRFVRIVYLLTPLIIISILTSVILTLAASDVVNDLYYIIYYILLGITATFINKTLLFLFFDISWIDDGLNNNNQAAALTVSGGLVGLTLIYAGSNIGEGPGWWTVVFASFLGVVAFVVLVRLVNRMTDLISKVTVDRNMAAAIRFSLYLIALGLILGKASSGDWTSFEYTVLEFFIGWPAILLSILVVIVESLAGKVKSKMASTFIGLCYVAFSVVALIYLVDLFDFVSIIVG